MDTGELQIIKDLSTWDRLLERSPQKTRYLNREFLSIFNAETRFYGMFKNGVCIAGIPVIDASEYGGSTLPWCYYQGPIFYDEIYRSSSGRLTQYIIELTEDMTTQLAARENRFYFSLNTNLTDVRGFDWVHYHHPIRKRCKIFPRYTAILDISEQTPDGIRKVAISSRRQEEKYAREREKLTVKVGKNIDTLKRLHAETFHRQGKEISHAEADLLETYADFLIKKGWGHVIEVLDESGTAVAAALLFEDIDKSWHVPIVGVGNTRYGGTLLYYGLIDEAKRRNGEAVDFNGANSPQRGYFKHSFGAEAKLFFEVSYSE